VKRLGRALWWAGPWLGLGLFIWRQQGLEARLAEWVEATNTAVQSRIGAFEGAAADFVRASEQGRVRDERV
jgi:hypothetical protein